MALLIRDFTESSNLDIFSEPFYKKIFKNVKFKFNYSISSTKIMLSNTKTNINSYLDKKKEDDKEKKDKESSLNDAKKEEKESIKRAKKEKSISDKESKRKEKEKSKRDKQENKLKIKDLRKELKSLRKLRENAKFEAEFSISGMILAFLNIFMLLPIGLVCYALLILMGYIDNEPYQYNENFSKAVKIGNESFLDEFFNKDYENCLVSSLAYQNALYYGNRKNNDVIFEYYNNGYTNYKVSNEVLSTPNIASFVSSNADTIKQKINNYFGVSNLDITDNLVLSSGKDNYVGMCYIHNKFDLDFIYDSGNLYHIGKFKTYNKGNLSRFPMEDNLCCYFIVKNNEKLDLIKDDGLIQIIQEEDLKLEDLDLKKYHEEEKFLALTPLNLSSITTNHDYVSSIADKKKYLFDKSYANLISVNCFEIRASDYYNEEQLSKFSDKAETLYGNVDFSNKIEGIDYIIDKNGGIHYNISNITDKEFGENAKDTIDGYISEEDYASYIKNFDINNVIILSSNFAFVLMNEKDHKIVMIGSKS